MQFRPGDRLRSDVGSGMDVLRSVYVSLFFLLMHDVDRHCVLIFKTV